MRASPLYSRESNKLQCPLSIPGINSMSFRDDRAIFFSVTTKPHCVCLQTRHVTQIKMVSASYNNVCVITSAS